MSSRLKSARYVLWPHAGFVGWLLAVGCWGRRVAARGASTVASARGCVRVRRARGLRLAKIYTDNSRVPPVPARAARRGGGFAGRARGSTARLCTHDTPAPMPPETASAFDSADLPRDGHSSLYLRSCSYLLFVLWFGSGEGGRRSILASRLDTSSNLFL